MMITPYKRSSTYDPASDSARALAIRWQFITRAFMTPYVILGSRGITNALDISDLKPGVSYVLASNHQSQLDSFIFISVFSRKITQRLLPFRAMTKNPVLQGGLLTRYLLGMGCFPSKPHDKMGSGVDLATRLLKDGQTVYICPEGRRTLPRATPARPGVALLASVPNVQIIPMRIQWKRHGYLGRTFKVSIGKPFNGKGTPAEQIMDTIYALPLP